MDHASHHTNNLVNVDRRTRESESIAPKIWQNVLSSSYHASRELSCETCTSSHMLVTPGFHAMPILSTSLMNFLLRIGPPSPSPLRAAAAVCSSGR